VVDAAPFRALRYDAAVAGDPAVTSAPAYDDLDPFEYARHRTASPYTVLELLAGDGGAGGGYDAAGAAFRRWLRTGVLVEEPIPAFYLYEIHELRQAIPAVLRGVLAAVSVTGDTLLPHEAVDAARITSRLQRLAAVPADLAPVFAVHTPADAVFREVVDAAPRTAPLLALTDEFGADHRVWPVVDPDATAALEHGLSRVRAVIADGHHRFAAAVELQRRNPSTSRTLTYLVDGETYGPQLLPVHRLVAPVPGDLHRRLEALFELHTIPAVDVEVEVSRRGAMAVQQDDDKALLLVARDASKLDAAMPAARSPAWRRLDSAIFDHIIRPLLGGSRVVYRNDIALAAKELRTTGDAALFILRPPPLASVYACAVAGEAMPAKSTWFRPKPRAGLVLRSLQSPP
jgi:uncharacterized protein (DUF1015 family)